MVRQAYFLCLVLVDYLRAHGTRRARLVDDLLTLGGGPAFASKYAGAGPRRVLPGAGDVGVDQCGLTLP